MLKTLWAQVGRYKKQAVLTPLFTMGEAVLEIAVPLVMASIIDDGIEAGSDFREFIAEKIRDSWQVLLFASHESIQPGFVRNEINYALHCGKPILRVNLDDVELTPGMELSLGGMQYVDATEPGGDYLERIVRTLLAERKEKA